MKNSIAEVCYLFIYSYNYKYVFEITHDSVIKDLILHQTIN